MTSPVRELSIRLDREVDGRWIGEVPAIPGVLMYGASPEAAIETARKLAADVMKDRRLHGEFAPAADRGGLTMRVAGQTAKIVEGSAPGVLVGYVDHLPGAHTQGESLGELYANLCEVVGLVTEDRSAPGLLPENEPSTREN